MVSIFRHQIISVCVRNGKQMTSQMSQGDINHIFHLTIKLRIREENVETPCVRKERDGSGAQLNGLVIRLIKYAEYIVIFSKT